MGTPESNFLLAVFGHLVARPLESPLLGRDLVNVFDNYLITWSSVRETPYIRYAIYKRNHRSRKPAQGVLGVSLINGLLLHNID